MGFFRCRHNYILWHVYLACIRSDVLATYPQPLHSSRPIQAGGFTSTLQNLFNRLASLQAVYIIDVSIQAVRVPCPLRCTTE